MKGSLRWDHFNLEVRLREKERDVPPSLKELVQHLTASSNTTFTIKKATVFLQSFVVAKRNSFLDCPRVEGIGSVVDIFLGVLVR